MSAEKARQSTIEQLGLYGQDLDDFLADNNQHNSLTEPQALTAPETASEIPAVVVPLGSTATYYAQYE